MSLSGRSTTIEQQPTRSLRQRWQSFWREVRARRAGRRGMTNPIARAARDVTGPTGWVFSNAWDKLDEHGDAYVKSFDRRIPPSLFVSERDRTRFQQPMPVAERCLEDYRVVRHPTTRPTDPSDLQVENQ